MMSGGWQTATPKRRNQNYIHWVDFGAFWVVVVLENAKKPLMGNEPNWNPMSQKKTSNKTKPAQTDLK